MTTTTEEKTLILKTDVLGRVHMPKERREAILDAFERSGMSGQAFAAQIGVKYTTFASWRQKRHQQRCDYPGKDGGSTQPITLLEAVVESKSAPKVASCLDVETAQGLRFTIRTSDEAILVAEFLRALSGGKSC
jgi:hypothetical protein